MSYLAAASGRGKAPITSGTSVSAPWGWSEVGLGKLGHLMAEHRLAPEMAMYAVHAPAADPPPTPILPGCRAMLRPGSRD